MKKYLVFIISIFAIFVFLPKSNVSDTSIRTNTVKKDTVIEVVGVAIIDTIILGDINNDKIADTAFIYTPPTIKYLNESGELRYEFGCVDNNCFNKISFSCGLPEIYIDISVWGLVENIGDLNNDGYNELIFSPGWFVSCWGRLYICSFNGNEWKKTTNVPFKRCEEESLKSHVKKGNGKYFLVGVEFIDGEEEEVKLEVKLE